MRSAEFVFDRTAEGSLLTCPSIVSDATTRGLPLVLRTDNGLEFCGRAMLTWATRGPTLRLIEPGKPTHDDYIESLNSRFRDECLDEYSFKGNRTITGRL